MVRVLALVTSLVLAGPMAAFAQAAAPQAATADDEGYARKGFYVGASLAGVSHQGLTTAIARRTSDATGQDVDAHVEVSAGISARVGYRFLPHVATEVQWEWLSPADVGINGDIEDSSAYDVKSWAVTGNLKGYLFPEANLQPFLLLGGGVMNTELEDRGGYGYSLHEFGFVGRMGGGLDYYFTRNLIGTIDLNYVLPVGDLGSYAFVSAGLGLQFRF